MACACNSKKASAQKFVVVKSNGTNYRTYTSRIEAEAAARRIGGTVK